MIFEVEDIIILLQYLPNKVKNKSKGELYPGVLKQPANKQPSKRP